METADAHNKPQTGSIEIDEPYTGNDYLGIIDSQRGQLRELHALVLTMKQRNDELEQEVNMVHQRCMELEKREWNIHHKLIDLSSML